MTEASTKKQPPSTRQLLDLINTVENYTKVVNPLLEMTLDNPTVDMNECLSIDKMAREKLTRLTRLLIAATDSAAFSQPTFMIGGDEEEGNAGR